MKRKKIIYSEGEIERLFIKIGGTELNITPEQAIRLILDAKYTAEYVEYDGGWDD